MKTKCGKEVHLVGIGVCGQPVVQIKVAKGSRKKHNAWVLARVIKGNIAIQFGSRKGYKLEESIYNHVKGGLK